MTTTVVTKEMKHQVKETEINNHDTIPED